MSVLVRFGPRKAIFASGLWRCADLALERRLNSSTETWIRTTGGPRIDDEDPERTAAEHIAAQFEGQLLLHMPARGRSAAQYFYGKRQLTFDFGVPPQPRRRRSRDVASGTALGA